MIPGSLDPGEPLGLGNALQSVRSRARQWQKGCPETVATSLLWAAFLLLALYTWSGD